MPRTKVHNGDPLIYRQGDVSWLVCCDCGLVHMIYVERVSRGEAVLRLYRDDYETMKIHKARRRRGAGRKKR